MPVPDPAAAGGPIPIQSLHHWAIRCRNAEETRHFYEDILQLPLVHVVYHDRVPSTGEYCPYFHIFFALADGSWLGFFDLLDDKAAAADPETPGWVTHLALRVDSRKALAAMKKRLEDQGVEVLGIIDHKIFDSIYFFDPNGMRLELTYHTGSPGKMEELAAKAHATLSMRAEKARERRAQLQGAA